MNMKDHFVIMLLCEYILVLLSIRPMGKPSFASSWIAHHVGREGNGKVYNPKHEFCPCSLGHSFVAIYLYVK